VSRNKLFIAVLSEQFPFADQTKVTSLQDIKRQITETLKAARLSPLSMTPDRDVVKAAGLDPRQIVQHTLRHTAITNLVKVGVDLPTVQRISGHKTLQMVARYNHQNGEQFNRQSGSE
jgi:integrase